MGKKRTRLEIMHDILEVIKNKNGKVKPTHILYKSNLSYQMMDEYLKELISKEFISQKNLKHGRTYVMNEKGFKFLEKYSVIRNFTESFGLE
jgi:predicted transcriptional regulator